MNSFYNNPEIEAGLRAAELRVLNNEQTSFVAAKSLLDAYFRGVRL